ncbi:MAG TPA: hypothetical protein VFV66_30630 [Nonomuraea sp.]|nr:hypothetical protein [Nonomuraea sp.]
MVHGGGERAEKAAKIDATTPSRVPEYLVERETRGSIIGAGRSSETFLDRTHSARVWAALCRPLYDTNWPAQIFPVGKHMFDTHNLPILTRRAR